MTVKRRKHQPTMHSKGEKFQGKEITVTLQAPSEMDLDIMITDLQDYAMIKGLEPIQILSKGPDPDGGYRAIITAHNFDPSRWHWSWQWVGKELRVKAEYPYCSQCAHGMPAQGYVIKQATA